LVPIFDRRPQQGADVDIVLPTGWEDLGAKGLVVLFVLMVFFGLMLPRRWVDKMLRTNDASWRRLVDDQAETIRVQRKTIEALTAANQDFAVGNYTAAHALRSVARSPKAGDEP
jgi:hypothetical protein